jgi:hypothetical protein
VASELLNTCAKHRADFVVLGTVGKGGPAIDQVGHVPREVLRFSPLPVILVPPTPVHALPIRPYVFVVAVDASPVALRCLRAVLKLMRPSDSVRIVHFYEKPLVGAYDEQPFAHCHEFLTTANVSGEVDILALEDGTTIAESLHSYTASHNASYLVLGLNGSGAPAATQEKEDDPNFEILENAIGRVSAAMLFSPRCTLCMCP